MTVNLNNFPPIAVANTGVTYFATTSGTTVTGLTTTGANPDTVINFKPKRKYWYKFTHYECPLCGTQDTVKERVYDDVQEKPVDSLDRHIDIESPCGYHFM